MTRRRLRVIFPIQVVGYSYFNGQARLDWTNGLPIAKNRIYKFGWMRNRAGERRRRVLGIQITAAPWKNEDESALRIEELKSVNDIVDSCWKPYRFRHPFSIRRREVGAASADRVSAGLMTFSELQLDLDWFDL
ncbi:hypothetical protein B0H11DRAFT_1910049 [Mycena galericulata]|nr:hypothetical protein B0H11DRAFT_1910049 [Mycena galericulata]